MAHMGGRRALGLALIAVAVCASGCSGPAADTDLWAEPGEATGTPAEAICDTEPTVTETAQEATIITGTMDGPDRVSYADFSGEGTVYDSAGTALPPVEATVELWNLTASDVSGIDAGIQPGDTIRIANIPWLIETDVPGVPVDLGRVRSDEIVVLISPDPYESANNGTVYWLADSCQVGASFFAVTDGGDLVKDPRAEIPWGTETEQQNPTVDEQLGVESSDS